MIEMRYTYERPGHYPDKISDDDALFWLVKHLAIPAVWEIDKGRNRVILYMIYKLKCSDSAMASASPSIDKAILGIDG
jgi:hypothetical protein